MKQSTVLLPLILSATLLATGCAEKKETTWLGTPPPDGTTSTESAGATSDTASATHPGSPGGTAVVPDVAAGTTVLVMLETNSLAVREQSIPKGPAILTLQNTSADAHALTIEGPGTNVASDTIAAGQTGTLEVMFQPGTYTFHCSILDHRTKGEEATVTIAP
jgi:uncharacterized cupredoxin-like copper-binding protein